MQIHFWQQAANLGAHSLVGSRPARVREALGSNPARRCHREVFFGGGNIQQVLTYADKLLAADSDHGAHGVVASHPLRMRKALGSNPNVSIGAAVPQLWLWQRVTC